MVESSPSVKGLPVQAGLEFQWIFIVTKTRLKMLLTILQARKKSFISCIINSFADFLSSVSSNAV